MANGDSLLACVAYAAKICLDEPKRPHWLAGYLKGRHIILIFSVSLSTFGHMSWPKYVEIQKVLDIKGHSVILGSSWNQHMNLIFE